MAHPDPTDAISRPIRTDVPLPDDISAVELTQYRLECSSQSPRTPSDGPLPGGVGMKRRESSRWAAWPLAARNRVAS
jgi:hypothetical protein